MSFIVWLCMWPDLMSVISQVSRLFWLYVGLRAREVVFHLPLSCYICGLEAGDAAHEYKYNISARITNQSRQASVTKSCRDWQYSSRSCGLSIYLFIYLLMVLYTAHMCYAYNYGFIEKSDKRCYIITICGFCRRLIGASFGRNVTFTVANPLFNFVRST